MVAGWPVRSNGVPVRRKRGAAGKWEGNAASGRVMTSHAASKRTMTQLECDEQSLSIIHADRTAGVGGVFGNSYVMGHGSYPR